MARAAGSGGHYEFVLKNLSTGRYQPDITIKLASVTTVLSAVLGKPFLVDWAARVTREGIAAWIDGQLNSQGTTCADVVDVLLDPEWAYEVLKDNSLRWQDIRDDAADRGKAEHATLEFLANAALKGDSGDSDSIAHRMLDNPKTTGFAKATSQWWLDTQPEVVASEAFVYDLREGYAGTVDLVTTDKVIDLKSRANHLGPYDSDHIQVGAYWSAIKSMGEFCPEGRSVLVIHEDGTYIEEDSKIDPWTFLDLLSVYNNLKGAKKNGSSS